MDKMSRRSFLKAGTAATAAFAMTPGEVLAAKAKKKASKKPTKLKVLGVGIGGRGHAVLNGVFMKNDKELYDDVELIGLADVDWKYAKGVMDKYQKFFPNCKMYNDYKKMYAELLDQADAVICGTADHTHAIVSAEALVAGKHVYCEKPLTRTVYESRLLTKLAAKAGVATQMGNQGASGEGVNLACEWLWNGEIGEVTKVEAFTDRPIWPQGLEHPEEVHKIPSTLNWDAFIGPAPKREYNEIYHPWNHRGWWDFGTGALGDMACHIMHPIFKALDLGYPIKVQGSSTPLMAESCPSAQMVKYTFPARPNRPKVAMPEVEVTWYDGGLMPPRPELIPADEAGNIKQKTEDLVGPYELHDFFLYHFMHNGYAPEKIYFLARKALPIYDDATIQKWLRTFIRRFFNQQFKRSCLPDGPKVVSVSLSPRGGWAMPSDACSDSFIENL